MQQSLAIVFAPQAQAEIIVQTARFAGAGAFTEEKIRNEYHVAIVCKFFTDTQIQFHSYSVGPVPFFLLLYLYNPEERTNSADHSREMSPPRIHQSSGQFFS
jgi:hypothetical protein